MPPRDAKIKAFGKPIGQADVSFTMKQCVHTDLGADRHVATPGGADHWRRVRLGGDRKERRRYTSRRALFLFEKGSLGFWERGRDLNLRPLGYKPYDAHLCHYGLSRTTALISANLRAKLS